MTDGSTQNATWPLPKFYFLVDISGVGTDLPFQEVTGLDVELQPIEYRHGNSKVFSTVKMPGIVKTRNVTLKRGVFVRDSKFWSWFDELKMNHIERRTVTIKLLDQDAKPKMIWTLTNAWPVKITSTDLKSDGEELAVETLEIAHEGIAMDIK